MASAQLAPPIAKTCEESRESGANAADVQHSSVGWWLGGVGSGVILGLIGTGIIWGVSFASSPQPARIPDNVEENCFRRGYKSEAKGSNEVGAGVGGLIGTLAFFLVVVSAGSGN